MKITYRALATLLALGLAGATYAQTGLPPIQTYGGTSFVTGGVGLDQSTAMKAAQKDYALSLLFVQTKRGEYLADVKVSIKDKSGNTVLQTVADGPMLLAKLPPGTYRISAEYDGKTLSKTVSIKAKGVTRAAFVWEPAAPGYD